MKPRNRMLFAFVVLLVAIACVCTNSNVAPTTTPPTNPPPADDPQQPTSEPDVQPTEEQAAPPPVSQDQQFFTEEFDAPLTNAWSAQTFYDTDKSDLEKVTVEPQNGKLVWDFESEYVYYYLFYESFSYTDVKVEARADNRGKNKNNVSLICRYDPEVGWYEFNVTNGGLYNIFYAEVASDGSVGWNQITNGGSNDIKQGKDVNEYSITCSGEKLSLAINGKEVTSITEKEYRLREGGVGVSVSSFNVLPILVEMDWFKVSEP